MQLRKHEIETIVRRLLEYRFREAITKNRAREKKLAERIYNDVFPAAERKWMAELPDGWLPTLSSVDARIGGHSYVRLACAEGLRVPTSRRHNPLKVYDVGHLIAEAYEDWRREHHGLRADSDKLKREALGVLTSARTMKRLLEMWPEVEPFTTGLVRSASHLPVVETGTLNAGFGLPAKGKAVAQAIAA